uniref:Uncharacterized protein n=1 Tax=Strigamia maritima TaxID=126957 RepID=T1JHJ4_STRMM
MMNFRGIWSLRLSIFIIFFFGPIFGQQVQSLNDKIKNMQLDEDNLLRKSRNVFMGMRGKKMSMDQDRDLQRAATSIAEIKRINGFMAMRGNKINSIHNIFDEVENPYIFPGDKRAKGFLGMRGKKQPSGSEMNRWSNSKFFAMRGKRD